ncbi:MAG: N-acetylglucosamine-6-phosphate deacetylase [Nocardioidaceae bacterium]|nr:N-acetylglucosamine-6-phosphate deacetylase [Nocardioidaceae bacterium]
MSRARQILRGRVVTPSDVIDDGVVVIGGDRLVYVGPAGDLPAGLCDLEPPQQVGTVLPGLVDIHCHGGGGHTLATDDVAEARAAAAHHLRAGTTSLVASLVTASASDLLSQVKSLSPLVHRSELAGVHLEGPFLSHIRCGAQDPCFLRLPDVEMVNGLTKAADGAIKHMTVAPELPGAAKVVAALRVAGVVVAYGHSDADYDTFLAALRSQAGKGLVTHLANGMPPLHHRAPGPVASSLVELATGDVTVELIADGTHLSDGFVALVFATAPAATDRIVLVTDAMAAAGMPDGDYALGSQRVLVREKVARLKPVGAIDGQTSIAGGTASLLEVVRRVVDRAGVDLCDAVRAASYSAARVLALADVGALEAGRRADLLILDDGLALLRVMRAGEWVT